jgi:chromosome segregation protein
LYLKRLEIHGFKSFADRTALDLQEGLNAVVGPNGSGKSNISDAILWVLGEQSARTLRGSRMEDVIFSGSSTRRPLGTGRSKSDPGQRRWHTASGLSGSEHQATALSFRGQ